MSVSVTTSFQDFSGATIAVPIAVNFPVMAITNIFMAKLLVGGETFIDLVPDVDFTRQDLGGGNYTVTTAATYAAGITIRVYRLTPNIQDYIFATTGPMNPEQIEAALDYRCMVEQEIAMLAGTPGMAPSAATLTVPGGGTGRVSLTAYALLTGGTTGLGALQQVAGLGTLSPQQYLASNGPGALASFKTLPAFGDVTGPAGCDDNAIPIFDGTTGKLLKAEAGLNEGPITLNGGAITDTTPRPVTIQQGWSNPSLVGNGVLIDVDDENSAAGSSIQQWAISGGNRGKMNKSGQIRLLDGNVSAPIYSFEAQTGTGIYRNVSNGALSASVAGTRVLGILTTVFEVFEELLVTITATQRFRVTATEITASLPVVPEVDNTTDLGSGSLAWRDLHISRNIFAEFVINNTSDITVASATTIAPVHPVQFVSGAVAIVTITPPTAMALLGGRITLIPTGAFTWTNGGNIAIAGTAVVGRALDMVWQSFATKWFPSYS